jgi:hypothetical protein
MPHSDIVALSTEQSFDGMSKRFLVNGQDELRVPEKQTNALEEPGNYLRGDRELSSSMINGEFNVGDQR